MTSAKIDLPRAEPRSVTDFPWLNHGWDAQITPDSLTKSMAHQLSVFSPTLLSDMNGTELLSRHEAKYVVPMHILLEALNGLGEMYAVLEVGERRLHRYRTLYFDTEDFAMFRRHQAGALNRYKVRAREYVESQATYFEIKHKTNKKRTIKHRYETEQLVTDVADGPAAFLAEACPYAPDELLPRLWSSYTRFTLVNQACEERVTVDLDLAFTWEEVMVCLPGVAVVEVKQKARTRTTEFMASLHAQHVRSRGFSKYCMGISLLYPAVKSNRFKVTRRLLDKLMRESGYE